MTLRRVAPHAPVTALAGVYAWYFARLSVAVQDGYTTFGFDMGIFDQGVWLLSRFRAPFVTVMGRDLFGDHTSFVLLLAVPLFWVHPAPQTLLVLQAVLLASATAPIYLLARHLLASTALATLLAGAYLANPALQQGNLDQFHPEAFLVVSISWAIWAAVTSRRRVLWLAVAVSLLVKEDTAVVIVPLGLWVAWRRHRRTGLGIAGVAVVWTVAAYGLVIYPLLGTVSFYAGRVPFGGLGGLATTAAAHPGRLVDYLRSAGRPFYLWQLGCSTGWTWVLSPEVAAIAVLGVAENTVSDFGYMHLINYHYTLALVPVLVAGTVWAVARLSSPHRRTVATLVVVAAAVTSWSLWGLGPISRERLGYLPSPGAAVAAIEAVQSAIPPGAVLSAWDAYVPHVDQRVRCYQWPTPFQAEDWALDRQTGQRLSFAGQVGYVFLPTHLTGDDLVILDRIRSRYRIVRTDAVATLWQRRPEVSPRCGGGRAAACAPRT